MATKCSKNCLTKPGTALKTQIFLLRLGCGSAGCRMCSKKLRINFWRNQTSHCGGQFDCQTRVVFWLSLFHEPSFYVNVCLTVSAPIVTPWSLLWLVSESSGAVVMFRATPGLCYITVQHRTILSDSAGCGQR